MDTTSTSIDGSDTHPAIAQTLMGVLDEIRWRHPSRRISCAAVIGPTLSVLGSSESPAMKPLEVRRIVGDPPRRLLRLLEESQTQPQLGEVGDEVRQHAAIARAPRLGEALLQESMRLSVVVCSVRDDRQIEQGEDERSALTP